MKFTLAMASSEDEGQMKATAFQKCHHVEVGRGLLRVVLNPVVTIVLTLLISVFVILRSSSQTICRTP